MPFKPDPANDPNDAYAVIPAPAELRGPLTDWWMVTRRGELVWIFPPDRRDLAIPLRDRSGVQAAAPTRRWRTNDRRDQQLTSTSALHRKYTAWLAERGYQPMTADELSLWIQGNQPRSSLPADKLADVQWLDGFIREWNDAADREDSGEDEDDA